MSKFTLEDPKDPKWRSNKYKFEDLPANVQGYIRGKLETPPEKFSILVPPARTSVLDLIYHTKIPKICANESSYATPPGHNFFSTAMPTKDTSTIQNTLIPPRTIVAVLSGRAKEEWLRSAESICVPGIEGYFPIWILHYWLHIHVYVDPVQVSWRRGLDWLKHKDFTPYPDQVKATFDSLATLSWTGNIITPGKSRELSVSKISLLTYLSRQWFSDEHIDQMIYYLEDDIEKSIPGHKIRLIDTILIRNIIQAYSQDQTGEASYDVDGSSFVPKFGRSLSETNFLGGIFHVHGNHWITLTVDIELEEIAYGDPASKEALETSEPILDSALRWFLSQHIPSLHSTDQLEEVVLPTPAQIIQCDSWNCGVYSFNALSHTLFKDRPLLENIGSSSIPGDLLRMDVLRQLIAKFNLFVWIYTHHFEAPSNLPHFRMSLPTEPFGLSHRCSWQYQIFPKLKKLPQPNED